MKTIIALLFGSNLPLAGLEVSVRFFGDDLCIDEKMLKINCDNITFSVGGFDHNQFFLNWNASDGKPYALRILNQADISYLIENSPDSLAIQFKQWQKVRSRITWVWSSLASITALVVICSVVLWWQYDQVVTWATSYVSIPQEQKLGESLLTQIEANGEIIKTGAAIESIQSIGKQLTQDSAYHYQWLIKKDKSVNAFALPGGIIIINSGLIAKLDNADELAAVLAHETQHVEQRHTLKRMVKSLGWAAMLIVVLGDVNIATAVAVHQLGNLYFSRDIEDEADRLGYQTLLKAGINPEGMLSMLNILNKIPKLNPPAWLSSHPDISERIKTIEAMLNQQPCIKCTSIDIDWEKEKLSVSTALEDIKTE